MYLLVTYVPEDSLENVKKALLEAHPYETPAYHIVKVFTFDDLD